MGTAGRVLSIKSRLPSKTELLVVLSFALAATPGCFVRRRDVVTPAARQTRPLLNATKDELIERIRHVSDPVHTFLMKANLSPSILNPSKGAATDYATVSAYILFLKPEYIRIIGQDPVIESTIFDMVSNAREFRVSIPRKKRFIIGRNDAPGTSANKLENLRPVALLTSLLINPPDPQSDFAVIENDTERALYILLIIHHEQDQLTLTRSVYFDRYSLQITQQKTFDPFGTIESDTKYGGWKDYNGIRYPSEIDIQRPKDNYEVQLTLVSMKINTPDVTPEKFILEQPSDFRLQELK